MFDGSKKARLKRKISWAKDDLSFTRDSLALYRKKYAEHKSHCTNPDCERCKLWNNLISQTEELLEKYRGDLTKLLIKGE